ncbi:hypothetical protein [Nostoc sp.]
MNNSIPLFLIQEKQRAERLIAQLRRRVRRASRREAACRETSLGVEPNVD